MTTLKLRNQPLKFLADLRKSNRLDRERLDKALEGLKSLPQTGDIMPLRGYPNEYRRLKTGDFRVIFIKEEDYIEIVKISRRDKAYKN